jgi:heavy metal sensor kinase
MEVHSVRFRIRVLLIAILGAALSIFSVYLYVSQRLTLYEELDNTLLLKAQEIEKTIDIFAERSGGGSGEPVSSVQTILLFRNLPHPGENNTLLELWLQKVDELDLKDDYVTFLDGTGEVLVRTHNVQGRLASMPERTAQSLHRGRTVYTVARQNGARVRVVSYPYFFHQKRYTIQVGTSLKHIMHVMRNSLIHILVSIPAILLIAFVFGGLFVRRFLKPVLEITRTASRITDENLSERVDPSQVDAEMKYLVDAFNNMISRLEKSFRTISDFSSEVAHELKTPLTIIKGESEIALRRERKMGEYRETIGTISDEADRMLRIIDDLLLLARLDFPLDSFTFEPVDVTGIVRDAYEQCQRLASGHCISTTLECPTLPLLVRGDGMHLRRLFLNLVDNAVKYNRDGGRVDVTLKREGDRVFFSVSDTGEGIDDTELSKIFDRFYRARRTEKSGVPGTGLGLSIVKSVAELHRGGIDVKSRPGAGSTFTVWIPSM